jgi:hypothetical protein
MMLFTSFLITSMIRLLIEWLIVSLRNSLYLSHYRLPQRGPELEVFKFILTVVIAAPILGTIGAYSRI